MKRRTPKIRRPLTNLQQLLDCISQGSAKEEWVSLGTVVEAIGNRSFGPLLLLPGIVLVSPLSGIPGMATFMGILVLLIASQLLIGRHYFWLPQWLLARSLPGEKVLLMIEWLRRPARSVDRFLRPRLDFFIQGISIYLIAMLCIAMALFMPAMELIPFSASSAGIALTTFGLALIANDGLLACIAFSISALTVMLVVQSIL
ncbi:exopolysaccharide biosynthesis protein [Cellvibrio polysaccharolyticus]|uniref:Exopolysaccharide biosynthesis protein n=1 Tax=Cellvibrio polysaccharolyticus TaxID=2082724 RepID=A0A928YSR3_9GAMM|nr:exopolysaccharide biosynthesis protein [Cellvibrio polysaccharolyticus]MBE8716681.1 exopolysaccharide biosynthesis protein [Cellvibrio polysaccharolyticus]